MLKLFKAELWTWPIWNGHNLRCKFVSELVIENFETSEIETVTDTDSRRISNLKLDPKNIFILEGKYGKILKRFRVGHIQDDKWPHLDSLFIDQKLKPVLISSYYKIKTIIYNFAQYICTVFTCTFFHRPKTWPKTCWVWELFFGPLTF